MTAGSPLNRLLVVDDSPDARELLQRNLSAQGYRVLAAGNVVEALEILASTPVDLVITDLKMPGASGLELVRHVRDNLANSEAITITGYPSLEGAVAAVKTGAEEYLAKPFTQQELLGAVARALDKLALRRTGLPETPRQPPNPLGLVAECETMRQALEEAGRAATTLAPVLIAGEIGTGKELLARTIHYASPMAAAPFVAVQCGAIPDELVAEQFFGSVASAQTGAEEVRPGYCQFAEGGTLFLHEVSELPPRVQATLVQVLDEHQYYAVGSPRAQPAGFRLIAASHIDLPALVSAGRFRRDLLQRLVAATIAVPALRERGHDVLLLAEQFLAAATRDADRQPAAFSADAHEVLERYPWPGNVAQLRSAIQQVALTTSSRLVRASDLPDWMRGSVDTRAGLTRTLAQVEAAHIRDLLASVGGNKTKAAQILAISRKTLREKLKQAGDLDPSI